MNSFVPTSSSVAPNPWQQTPSALSVPQVDIDPDDGVLAPIMRSFEPAMAAECASWLRRAAKARRHRRPNRSSNI